MSRERGRGGGGGGGMEWNGRGKGKEKDMEEGEGAKREEGERYRKGQKDREEKGKDRYSYNGGRKVEIRGEGKRGKKSGREGMVASVCTPNKKSLTKITRFIRIDKEGNWNSFAREYRSLPAIPLYNNTVQVYRIHERVLRILKTSPGLDTSPDLDT